MIEDPSPVRDLGESRMANFDEIHLSSPQAAAPDFAHGSLLFIGTATVLLRYGGFTILTDTNFLHAGDHAYLGDGLTSARLTEPALRIEDLPPVDFLCPVARSRLSGPGGLPATRSSTQH